MYDTIFRGGAVLDGNGGPAVKADVAVRDGRIEAVGDLDGEKAGQTVDAGGLTIAPGFIDIHSHDDFNLPINPLQPGKILQGVTTQVTGNCGWSPAPIVPERRKDFVENAAFLGPRLDYAWEGMGDFLERMPPTAQNIAQLVGHVPVRTAIMGGEDRPPTADELERMQALVDVCMREGAFGFSTGLIYPPSAFGQLEEISALAAVAARHGGGYHTHMRNEGEHLFKSVREAAEIGRRSGAVVQISHLKISGKAYWGQARQLLELIAAERASGVTIYADQYPYPAGSSGLKSLLPTWTLDGGNEALIHRLQDPTQRDQIRAEVLEGMSEAGYMKIEKWTDVMIADSPSDPSRNGFSLEELSQRDGKIPADAMLDILLDDYAKTLAVFFIIGVEDMEAIMADPHITIGSDGILTVGAGEEDKTKPHPRYFGTFPRVLGKYAREEGLFSVAEAVRKMTALSADALGLKDRGRVAPGQAADLVLFDPATVADTATYRDPLQFPRGIQSVWVNGACVARDGRETGEAPGAILRRVNGA